MDIGMDRLFPSEHPEIERLRERVRVLEARLAGQPPPEERLRLFGDIVDASEDGIVYLDRFARYVLVNKG